MKRPLRPCQRAGCSELTNASFCTNHQRTEHHDNRRGSAAERGYGSRWARFRRWFIHQTQCSECGRNHALCEECQREGKVKLAFAVDHIRPHRGDQALFWLHSNLQGLCERHHNAKSAREVIER